MNLRASRHRILPVVIVLIALAASGTSRPRSSSAPMAVPKPAADPVLVTPPPAEAPSEVAGASLGGSTPVASIPQPAQPTPKPAEAGMVIAIDPETGALGPPTDSQWAELRSAASLARSRAALVEIRRPDGAVGIDVGNWLQEFAVVRTGPDGKPIFGCLRPGEASSDSAAAPLEIQ